MSPNWQDCQKKNRTETDLFCSIPLVICIYPATSNLSDIPHWIPYQPNAFLFLGESLSSHRWSRAAHIAP